MEITLIKTKDIKPYENNPRKNDDAVPAVMESIKQFGFRVPIIIDKDNTIIAGHTRWKAAKRMKLNEIPCIVAEDMTESQIKAFRIADNKVGELALWDDEKLMLEIKDLVDLYDWNALGLDLSEYDPLQEAKDDDFDLEETLEEIKEPISKRGEIYQLGDHRLMCGDSTSKEDVKKLVGDIEIELVITDPPYNVNYGSKADAINKYNYHFSDRRIMNDYMPEANFIEFLTDAFASMFDVIKAGASFYIFHASSTVLEFETALRMNNLKTRQQLIWVKNAFVIGRQDYQWRHEPFLYGWKEGAAHHFIDDRTQSTVFDKPQNFKEMKKDELVDLLESIYKNNSIIYFKKPSRSDEHPTMKPIELIGKLMENSSQYKQTVLDLFGGSGSTLIAAEQLKRKAYMMELDPKFVDVIIIRWEKLTGKKAVKIEVN